MGKLQKAVRAVKVVGATGRSISPEKKKQLFAAQLSMDSQNLDSIGPDASVDDAKKLVSVLRAAREKDSAERAELTQACCEAAIRACGAQAGYLALVQAGGVEALLEVYVAPPEEVVDIVGRAVEALHEASAVWADTLEGCDLPELNKLVYITNWLGSDQDVAVGAIEALQRYALHSSSNCLALLQANILQAIHRILGSHRAPELCHAALSLIFILFDLPSSASPEKYIAKEKGLILSVVETLDHAPVNMRLQLIGFKLLALWWKMGEEKEEVRQAILEANAIGAFKRCIKDLHAGGLMHVESWFSMVAGRAFKGAIATHGMSVSEAAGDGAATIHTRATDTEAEEARS